MLYELGQVSKRLKNETAKLRKAAQSRGWKKSLRLFALLSVLCGFKTPSPIRFIPLVIALPFFLYNLKARGKLNYFGAVIVSCKNKGFLTMNANRTNVTHLALDSQSI